MKHSMLTLMAVIVLVFSLRLVLIVHAAYLIKLKNGNEFVTGRYWQEGRQLLFDIYGGVFGVDRAFVSKIEESGLSISVTELAQEAPERKPQADLTDKKGTKLSTVVD